MEQIFISLLLKNRSARKAKKIAWRYPPEGKIKVSSNHAFGQSGTQWKGEGVGQILDKTICLE